MRTFKGQKVISVNPRFRIAILLWIAIFLLSIQLSEGSSIKYPSNLWQGLVAESTSGDYQVYLIVASVVRNRLEKRLNHGLNSLRRRDLVDFVAENYLYVLRTKGIDLEELTKKAIYEVFILGKDYANGGTRYEHTKKYGIPKDNEIKGMRVVKIIYKGTRREITCWGKD